MKACFCIRLAWCLGVLFALTFVCSPSLAAEFAGGTGDPNDPYRIATAQQLLSIGVDPNLLGKHYLLVNDIDFDPNLPGRRVFDRAVIGKAGLVKTQFRGSFSGGGHIIRNLVIVSEQSTPIGLFADVGRGAKVEQLGIENARVSGTETVGTLAGENGGTITACYSTGIVRCLPLSKDSADKATPDIDEGYARMMEQLRQIYGDRYMGVPEHEQEVEVPARAGGLVGRNAFCIESCYSEVKVKTEGEDPNAIEAGGLVGANSGHISASYSLGLVAAGTGGLVGTNTVVPPLSGPVTGRVFLSFWDVQASGTATSGAGMGRTTAQMMDKETYPGWDYGGFWTIDDGADYPRLRWEERAGAPMPAFTAYVDGTGEPNDPFVIRTASELVRIGCFRATWDRHLVLANDVDMSAVDPNDFAVIGTPYRPFTGTFDGRGHTIRNFTYHLEGDGCAGLFGRVGHARIGQLPRAGLIENVTMRQGSVTGITRVGLLVAENWGTIRACHVEGTVIGTKSYAGGLVGFNAGRLEACSALGQVKGLTEVGGLVGSSWTKKSVVENCRSHCTVTGQKTVGGLAGYAGGSVHNSYATGDVEGADDVGGLIGEATARVWACYATGHVTGKEEIGGLVGYTAESSRIKSCYARGTVTGQQCVGGLIGAFDRTSITNSYAAAVICGDEDAGGFIGKNLDHGRRVHKWYTPGTVSSCFWDTQVAGVAGGTGGSPDPDELLCLSTDQMQTMTPFVNAGWDFDTVWTIREGDDYPRLRWERD